MFATKNKRTEQFVPVTVVASDQALLQRVQHALGSVDGYNIETVAGPLAEQADLPCSLLVVELTHPFAADLAALERITRQNTPPSPAVIVIADGLDEAATRALFKLNAADWLPSNFSGEELIAAAHQALQSPDEGDVTSRTTTIAFMPAIGGAGASTLSIVAMEVLCAERQSQRSSCCVVNLNLQAGAVADYLDVRPNLDLEDIARAPERLDAHLLEIMLSQHKSGYSVLSALPSLSASESVNPQIIGRLLDLASTKFSTLIIDMPGLWMPWCDSVLHGTDKLYFVTDMSVAGLRHGQRLAQLVSDRHGVELNGSVIVNKSARLGVAGVKKQHAEVLLGSYFAGFIPDGRKHVQVAQNQGILPSEYKRKNALNTALRKILIQA